MLCKCYRVISLINMRAAIFTVNNRQCFKRSRWQLLHSTPEFRAKSIKMELVVDTKETWNWINELMLSYSTSNKYTLEVRSTKHILV